MKVTALKESRLRTMMRCFAFVCALLPAVTAAHAQVVRNPPVPIKCDCSATAVIDADGGLNVRHCNATRVLAILDRYAERTARLLPERVEPVDLELLGRKLERERREAVGSLLTLMTWDELGRFLPFLRNGSQPGRQPGVNYGTWHGANIFACGNAVYWINEGLERIGHASTLLVSLQNEGPCDPAVLMDSLAFQNGLIRFGEAFNWLQLAADNMTAEKPALASIAAYAAWWASLQGSLAFVIGYSMPPLLQDSRCEDMATAGLALAEAGGAARQAWGQADACAQGQ